MTTRLTPAEVRDALTLANETHIGTVTQLTAAFGPLDPRTDRARQLWRLMFNALDNLEEYMALTAKPVDLTAPPVVMPVRRMGGAA